MQSSDLYLCHSSELLWCPEVNPALVLLVHLPKVCMWYDTSFLCFLHHSVINTQSYMQVGFCWEGLTLVLYWEYAEKLYRLIDLMPSLFRSSVLLCCTWVYSASVKVPCRPHVWACETFTCSSWWGTLPCCVLEPHSVAVALAGRWQFTAQQLQPCKKVSRELKCHLCLLHPPFLLYV